MYYAAKLHLHILYAVCRYVFLHLHEHVFQDILYAEGVR